MMVDLSTSFAGLTLQSPLILGSSGLARNVDRTCALVEPAWCCHPQVALRRADLDADRSPGR